MFFKNKKTNMELEILEQVKIIPEILRQYIDTNSGDIKIDLPQNVEKIVIVASGSSYHCARFAVEFLEKYSKIETRAIYSSEFLIKTLIPKDENTLYVFITQSGETSDTLKSLERVKKETNLPALCITNVENSTIWNLSDYKVSCCAGVESGVAATKSFTSQMLCLILVALKLIEINNSKEEMRGLKDSLLEIPEVIKFALSKKEEVKKIAKFLTKQKVIVLTAEGISYSLAKEGALKIKETSYKNISAAILGEFMHGHVAVLNNKATLFYISVDKISDRAINNLNKIKKDYNPKIIIIGREDKRINADFKINLESKNEIQQMFFNVVILQQIALETALYLKCNVDNPKGLHKVVVEKLN